MPAFELPAAVLVVAAVKHQPTIDGRTDNRVLETQCRNGRSGSRQCHVKEMDERTNIAQGKVSANNSRAEAQLQA